MERPVVPATIQTPPEDELLLVVRARGVQIYVCHSDGSGRRAWVLKAPEAMLYDARGNVIGKHFAGPTWKHNDGSEITAKVAAKVDSPDPSAIPWLLLRVSGHSGEGALSRVTMIQRIHTFGGLAPGSGCTELPPDAESKSEYSADYYFYAPKK